LDLKIGFSVHSLGYKTKKKYSPNHSSSFK